MSPGGGGDGGNGVRGGDGGRVEVTAARITNLTVTTSGSNGKGGGRGQCDLWATNAAGQDVCGLPGRDGDGGNGGDGGLVLIRTQTNYYSGTNSVSGGSPASQPWSAPCYPCGYLIGAGVWGATGLAGQIVFENLSSGSLVADLQADRASVHPGETIVYTLTVKALEDSHSGLAVKLKVPTNTVLDGATTNYSLAGDTLSWSVPVLGECELLTFTQRVTALDVAEAVIVVSNWGLVSASGVPEFPTDAAFTLILYESKATYGKHQDVPYNADPVHPGLGNYVCSKSLAAFGGASLPVQIEATYNSLDHSACGPLGFGWTHTYHVTITETGGVATLRMGDGQQLTFQAVDPTNYVPHGCATRLALRKPATNRWEAVQYNGVMYVFDGQGRLTRLEDPNGLHVDLAHSTQLDRITDTAGRQTDFTWNAGRISAITVVPLGRSVQFQYDGASNLAAIVDLRGYTNRFAYDAEHRMTAEWDARGYAAIRNTYDAPGRVIRQVNALNQQTSYSYADDDPSGLLRVVIAGPAGSARHYYDGAMNLRRIVDTAGQDVNFTYNEQGRRLTAVDKLDRQGSFGYDAAGNPTSLINRAGADTGLSYGPQNRLSGVRDGAGASAEMNFDAKGNLASTEDALGHQRFIVCDGAGRPTSITDARGKTWNINYNAQGEMETVTDPAGSTVTYTYDAVGRLVSASQPGNPSVRPLVYFDARGNPTGTVDAAGNRAARVFDPDNNMLSVTFEARTATTYYAYNALNQLTNITDALGGKTDFTYDFAGRLVSVKDPDGVAAGTGYDAAGRPVARTDALGRTTLYVYDGNGNLIAATNPAGKGWRFRYDEENRLIEVEDSYGATRSFGYDAVDRLTAITNADGTAARREHDALGRIVRSTAEDGGVTEYGYDGDANLTRLTDPMGRTWEYEYDDVSRRTLARDPLGREETYRYNAAGFMTNKVTRDGKSYRYGYDALGRLTAVALPDGAGTVQFQYDCAGNLIHASDAAGSVSMTYDKLNRKTSFTDRYGNTIQYRYTPAGRLAAVVYPGDRVVTNRFDALGRVTNTLDWTGRKLYFQYNSLNQLTNLVVPNGARKTYSYDDEGRIIRLRHLRSGGGPIEDIQFSYDAAGRITGRTRDTTGLVASVSSGFGRYTYDAAGRLLSRVADGVTNLCLFDARGNMTSKTANASTTTLRYDPLNRLVSTASGGLTVSNVYDAAGNRCAQWVNGVETRWLADGGRAWVKYNGSGGIERFYVYAAGLAYSLDASSNLVVFHDDERGSILEISDYTQVVVQAYAYSPYGILKAAQGGATNEFQFAGAHGTASDTNGLLFMRARYYDPALARFITEDPLGLAMGLNLYAYAGGDPIGKIDPQGLAETITLPPKNLPPTTTAPPITAPQGGLESIQQQILRYEAELQRNSQWGEYWLRMGNYKAAGQSVQQVAKYQQAIAQLESDLYRQAPGLRNTDWRATTPFKNAPLYNTLPSLEGEVVKRGFSPGNFVRNVGRGIYRTGSNIFNAVRDEVVYYVTCGSIPVGAYIKFLISQGAKVAIVEGGMVVIVLTAEFVVVYAITEEVMAETGLDQYVTEFFEAGMPLADNTVNLELFYRQKYQRYYDTADRCDQKIKDMLATGLIRLE